MLTDGLYTLDDGVLTLTGGRSRSSGLLHFPLATVCPYRGTDDVEPVALPRTGSLWAWTVVTTAPPGYHGPVPYCFGVVELDDGTAPPLRVVGRLAVADPAALAFGDPMVVVAEELADGDGGTFTTWAFGPTGP